VRADEAVPAWRRLRLLGGLAVLGALVWRLGTGPFVEAISRIDAWPLAAAAGIGAITTVCCAWRWSVVARGLGVEVPLGTAVSAYYRSQFLNTTLPAGVLGDVHRAVRLGRQVGDVRRSARAVVWERGAGQAVQLLLALVVLLLLPSPVRAVAPALVVVAVVARARRPDRRRWHHPGRRALPAVALASTVVVAGHAATFLIAARTAGVPASPARLLPLALVVLLAMGLPLNVAGWGPREGAAAWIFGLAGLDASQGVTTAVVYGVMVAVACLPGAGVLAVSWAVRRRGGHLPGWARG